MLQWGTVAVSGGGSVRSGVGDVQGYVPLAKTSLFPHSASPASMTPVSAHETLERYNARQQVETLSGRMVMKSNLL